ncbi:cyclin-F isoform X3 [Poecile atricapillus]|uniref:cyclin-F isoform X3 n=1 Tax=Poecile atricapillus TaxID=48891 RepID=UPI00273875AB|nr:cyclin-F isoform X3 [Poecile atricapillus]
MHRNVQETSSKMVHCRCSRCFSFPSKRRIIKRPRVLTFLNLPEDVLFHILKGLPAADILSVRAVHSHLKYLVDNHSSVWAHASFQDLWPSPNHLRMFERAAESGNFEAAVKLSLAYLYNEGLSITGHGRAEVNGIKASHYFSLAEHLNVCAVPFIWLFIRPPWSFSGSCCKAVVYESLKAECQLDKAQKGSILHSLAKVLNFFEDEGKKKESLEMLEESSKQGCLISSYLLWENNRKAAMSDPGRYLQSLRKLRDYAAKGCWEAQIALAKACGNGNQLGLEAKSSREMVSQIFQASLPISKQSIFTVQKGMNEIMRYILVDWLVEVATMKDFSSLCLHMTVGCVDRYLKLRPVPRAQLQLLGIACMVICTRFHDDVPKDYRQVSLMAVKQRFEDERYEEIGKEQVMSYSQLCSVLGVKQEDPEPSPLHRNVVEIQTFLSSPSGKRAKRRREDSIQDDRGSFVTTPTAELSSQEESLLDNFLDWSLDSCSGYEGDQESEGEREGDVTSPSGILDVTVLYLDPAEHCGQDSSDEDSLPGEWDGSGALHREGELPGAYLTPRNPNPEGSSGYSSVNTASPTSSVEGSPGAPPKPTSALPHGNSMNREPCQPHYLHRRQVKRKNMAEHTEERLNLGFLSL